MRQATRKGRDAPPLTPAVVPAVALADFMVCDVFDASPKNDLGSMEHPIFSLSTRPDRRILSYAHNGTDVVVTPSVRGRATMHDKDILIYCISQMMAALNAGRAISRVLHLRAHDLLIATRRDTSGDAYARLREAFERLAGTRITTNLTTGGEETISGFGLIEAWEIVRASKGGRMTRVKVVLSEWLFRAVAARSVLTLSRDYFSLRKPLERRIYELARKHCGRQAEWKVSLGVLHKKSGSTAPLRVFRAAIRRMIADANLPGYDLHEGADDILYVTRRDVVVVPGSGPQLSQDALAAARALATGEDVYALEAEWRSWWVATGAPTLRNADAAFVGWVTVRGEGR